MRQYEGAVKSDQANVDNAKLQLDYSRITAPISGRLGLRQVDKGNLVSSSDTNGLVVITQTQPISVVFTLPETQLPEVRAELAAGHTLTVEAYDRADTRRIATGKLETLDNQIDVATGTLKLKARFDNADDALFPNQFVNARLHVTTRRTPPRFPSRRCSRARPALSSSWSRTTIRWPCGRSAGRRQQRHGGGQRGPAARRPVVTEGTDRLRAGPRSTWPRDRTRYPSRPTSRWARARPPAPPRPPDKRTPP